MQTHVLDVKENLAAVGQPSRDQILDDLLLAVDRDPLADQTTEIEMMQRAVEAEKDAVMPHRLALQAFADAGLHQQVGCPLLEHAGAHALLDIGTAAAFEHDRVNATAVQQMGEHQPRGAGADNPDLRPHRRFSRKASHKRTPGGAKRDEARKGWNVRLAHSLSHPGPAHGQGAAYAPKRLTDRGFRATRDVKISPFRPVTTLAPPEEALRHA